MATYHCTVKVGGKGAAAPHADYIAREGKYRGAQRHEDLEATAHGNMPDWAQHNPSHYWTAADAHERANGATYREIEVALPRELTPQQRRALVEDFITQELGDRHAYQWAIHTPKAALEKGEQPHAHIMYSERTQDGIARDPEQHFKRYNAKNPERGGCRKDSAGTEERLQATRARWADLQNQHLQRHGHSARVDHRSLAERGIQRTPEKHLGPDRAQALAPMDVAAILERRAAEGERERAQQQISQLDLSGDLSAALADRARTEQPRENEAGVTAAMQRFELHQQIDGGVQDALQSFERWQAQREAERLSRERTARQQQAERENRENRDAAALFQSERVKLGVAVKAHPKLAGPYAVLGEYNASLREQGLDEPSRQAAMATMRNTLAQRIERGQYDANQTEQMRFPQREAIHEANQDRDAPTLGM